MLYFVCEQNLAAVAAVTEISFTQVEKVGCHVEH